MILVTGATGLVGTHLLIKLTKDRTPIRALYRTERKKEQAQMVFLQCSPNPETLPFVEWVQGDLTDIPSLTDAMQGITHVYHCAAKISFNPQHFQKLRKVNIEGTANIVNLCIALGVKKLCHVSSIAALGEQKDKDNITEKAEWNPEVSNSVYAITKYGAEMEVWRGTQEGLDAVIVNPGIIIGPGFYETGSGYIFKKIYRRLRYYTTGTTGYIGIDDVVNIMQQLMTSSITNERFILVAENLSFKHVFTLIAKGLKKKTPEKKVSKFLLKLAYYIQWFGNRVFGTKQYLFRSSLHNAFTNSYYNHQKVKEALGYEFEPIQEVIQKTATLFLEQERP